MKRPLDIGYRAYAAPAWLGSFGLRKAQPHGRGWPAAPWSVHRDICSDSRDTFHGDDWHRCLLRCLLRCRYTVGIEGGTGILDRDGSIQRGIERFLSRRPGADVAEIEQARFPGLEGSLALTALSTPSSCEDWATRTCQVLVEGHYNGILVAGKHDLELRADCSNLDEVLALLSQDSLRRQIVEQAYHDVVENPRHAYPHFVSQVLEACLPEQPLANPADGAFLDGLCARAAREDRRSWLRVRLLPFWRLRINAARRLASRLLRPGRS